MKLIVGQKRRKGRVSVKMVELEDKMVTRFTEDFNRMVEDYQTEHDQLSTKPAPTEKEKEKINHLENVLKQLNKATQLDVQLSDLEAFGLNPQDSPTGDTGVPEGVLVWRLSHQASRPQIFSKKRYLRKIEELKETIRKSNRKISRKEFLEAQLKRWLKAP